MPNPYTICSTKKLPKICRQTTRLEPPAGALYPSVFARWRFTVDGYQDTPIPEPGNEDMYIQAKVMSSSISMVRRGIILISRT